MCIDMRLGRLAVSAFAVVLLSTGCSMAGPTVTTESADAKSLTDGLDVERGGVSSDAMQRFNFSKSAMAQSSWKVAEEGFLTLADDYPELSGPALNLALVYRHKEDNRQAEHWFKQSFARNKNNLQAYNQYAIFLREQGRFEQAEAAYQQALSISEADADTHLNLGILYDLYRGEKKSALQHFYRYQELQLSEDRVVAGWIADLERQLNSVAVAE
jgi:tetratricopeptide (TPR) repeat protein